MPRLLTSRAAKAIGPTPPNKGFVASFLAAVTAHKLIVADDGMGRSRSTSCASLAHGTSAARLRFNVPLVAAMMGSSGLPRTVLYRRLYCSMHCALVQPRCIAIRSGFAPASSALLMKPIRSE